MNRRQFAIQSSHIPCILLLVGTTAPAAADALPSSIADRFNSDIITYPPITSGTGRTTGHDNLYFPYWMEGEWDVTQTLVATKAPLGLKFLGGPSGSLEVATKTMEEQTKHLNESVNLQLRFVKTKFGFVEDRAYNLKSRLNAFAGKSVVSRVEYANVKESNRAAILSDGGTDLDPLMTTVVYFKGPAAQKTFVISHGEQETSDQWFGYEVDRSIFALTNQNTAPPITTDTELLYSFEKITDNQVKGRLRLAGYLNPQSDKLYFETNNKAVSLNDYTLILRKGSSDNDNET